MPDKLPEKQPLANGRTSSDFPDWSTLLGQAIDDVSRILRSEAEIVQTRIGAALKTSIAASLAILPPLILVIWGAACLLLASVLLLHEWVPLWQAFGIAGLCLMTIGAASALIIRRRQQRSTE